MNLLELKSKVIEKLKERSTPKYWPVAEITDNINRGCRRFSADTRCKETTLNLAASSAPDGLFTFPDNIASIDCVMWLGKRLGQTSVQELDSVLSGYQPRDTDWRTETGTPTHWVTDGGLIRIYPIPLSFSVGNAKIRCVITPADMTGDSDVPDLPSHLQHFHDALWLWALVECYSREGQQRDPSLAEQYVALYKTRLEEYGAAFSSDSSAPMPTEADLVSGDSLLSLKNKVVENIRLQDGTIPWRESEIVNSLNRSCRKFAADTKCKETSVQMGAFNVYTAAFNIPSNAIRVDDVFWKNKKLVRTTAGYLDDYFSGYTDQMKIGEIPSSSLAWREVTAELPTHWFIEDAKIKLYPIPDSVKRAPCRFSRTSTLLANETEIFIDVPISTNKNNVELYLNGVWQNKDQWEIIGGRSIELIGPKTRDQVVEIVWVSAADRASQIVALPAGTTTIALPLAIPEDQAFVDVFLNGFYQNQDKWSITNPNAIEIAGPLARDQECEIVYYPAAPFSSFNAFKRTFTILAGNDSVTLPVSYEVGTNAIAVRLDGLSQAPSTFTETNGVTVTLSTPVTRDKTIEITVFRNSAYECSAKGVYSPAPMAKNSDQPDLPAHMAHFIDAIWILSLSEFYSMPAQKDLFPLSQVYAAKYSDKIREFKNAYDPPVEFLPRDPWKV